MKTFSGVLAICAGNSPVNSPHKGHWRGALMFSLICALKTVEWTIVRLGDLRRHRVHYHVIVMVQEISKFIVPKASWRLVGSELQSKKKPKWYKMIFKTFKTNFVFSKNFLFTQNILNKYLLLNSFWPKDAIWRQKYGSTLAQAKACCLTAPSHYLSQCVIDFIYVLGAPGLISMIQRNKNIKILWAITEITLQHWQIIQNTRGKTHTHVDDTSEGYNQIGNQSFATS